MDWSVFAAHGLRLRTGFRLPLAEVTGPKSDVDLSPASRKDLPSLAGLRWSVRGNGHLDIGHSDALTVLSSYCGSVAWFAGSPQFTPMLNIYRAPSISTARFAHSVLHSFLPNALTAWHMPMVHAAAIVVGGRVILFSGQSGAGKSTLAAGFLRRGVQVLADDVIRLERSGAGYVAYPSYPGARLRGNSFLLPGPDRRTRGGTFGLPKFRIGTDSVMPQAPLPVAAMLFIGRSRSPHPSLARLAGSELLNEWLQASFVQALPPERFAREAFSTVGAMAQCIPSYRMCYKRSPARFDGLLDEIVGLANGLIVR